MRIFYQGIGVFIIWVVSVLVFLYFEKRPTVIMDPVTKECYEVINGDFECGQHYGKKYNVQWERRKSDETR